MKPQHKELPIFLDVSGRRWRIIKIGLVTAVCSFSLLGLWVGGRILSPESAAGTSVSAMSGNTEQANLLVNQSVDELADSISKTNTPIIGDGPLARVVQVKNNTVTSLSGPFPDRSLTEDESKAVGTHQYAIEKYGATSQGKRLILTFDDGPDADYTPRLLDVLSQESIPATFFLVGNRIIQHPEIAQRIVREGHDIGNHSFTHVDFESTLTSIAQQEINLTDRILRKSTGYSTTFFRPPYVGDTNQSLRGSVRGILNAQKMGYTVALYDFDTNDWQHASTKTKIPMPSFDGKDHVLLLHDGGGKRDATIAYVKALATEAKKHGYSFSRLSSLYPAEKSFFKSTKSTFEDSVFMTIAQVVLVWPLQTMMILFTITLVFVFFGMGAYMVLAIVQNRRTYRSTELSSPMDGPSVAIIVPAYNEAKVLRGCIESLLRSSYKKLKVFIVDDGSTDNTWKVAQKLANRYKQVTALHQANGGKASALNRGIRRTRSRIVICIDADTQFQTETISRLVRHFADPSVGAVAGLVKVGNRVNILARCQALEYSTSISLERTAQALLGAIMVVPGACGAWRREAIVQAGRYSHSTLAEDCDLTIALHMAKYRVVQDNTAVAFTEVPATLRDFVRQRFRWAFGNVQVFWKYRKVLFSNRNSWLDSFVLPMAITSTMGPLIFLPLLGVLTLSNILNNQYEVLFIFITLSLVFHFLRAWIGLALGHERLRYLLLVPVARVLYGPLRIYLIYGTMLRAVQGMPVGWRKVARVGMILTTSVYKRQTSAKT